MHIQGTSGSNLSGYETNKVSRRAKKNLLLGGMLLPETNECSKTGNIKELWRNNMIDAADCQGVTHQNLI